MCITLRFGLRNFEPAILVNQIKGQSADISPGLSADTVTNQPTKILNFNQFSIAEAIINVAVNLQAYHAEVTSLTKHAKYPVQFAFDIIFKDIVLPMYTAQMFGILENLPT